MILIIIVMINLLVAPTLSIYIYIYILIKNINFIKNKYKMITHYEEELVQENKETLQYWYLVIGEFCGYHIFVKLFIWFELKCMHIFWDVNNLFLGGWYHGTTSWI